MLNPLSPRQKRGFEKTGDLFLPGGDGFPSFSGGGFLSRIDEILESLPAKDRADLLGLMTLLGFLPSAAIRLVLALARTHAIAPLRLLDFGLKGIFYTLYYSEERVFPLIHWDAKTVS